MSIESLIVQPINGGVAPARYRPESAPLERPANRERTSPQDAPLYSARGPSARIVCIRHATGPAYVPGGEHCMRTLTTSKG